MHQLYLNDAPIEIPSFDLPIHSVNFLPIWMPIAMFLMLIIFPAVLFAWKGWKKAIYWGGNALLCWGLTVIFTLYIVPIILNNFSGTLVEMIQGYGVQVTAETLVDTVNFMVVPLVDFVFMVIICFVVTVFISLPLYFLVYRKILKLNKKSTKTLMVEEIQQINAVDENGEKTKLSMGTTAVYHKIKLKPNGGVISKLVGCVLFPTMMLPMTISATNFLVLFSVDQHEINTNENKSLMGFYDKIAKLDTKLGMSSENPIDVLTAVDGALYLLDSQNKHDYKIPNTGCTFNPDDEKTYTIVKENFLNAFLGMFSDLFMNIAIPDLSSGNISQALHQIWYGNESDHVTTNDNGIVELIRDSQAVIKQMNDFGDSLAFAKVFFSEKLCVLIANLLENYELPVSLPESMTGQNMGDLVEIYITFVLMAINGFFPTNDDEDWEDTTHTTWQDIEQEYQKINIFETNVNPIGEIKLTLYDLFCKINPLSSINLESLDIASLFSIDEIIQLTNGGSLTPEVGSYIWMMSILDDDGKLFVFDGQPLMGDLMTPRPLFTMNTGAIHIEIDEFDIDTTVDLKFCIGTTQNADNPYFSTGVEERDTQPGSDGEDDSQPEQGAGEPNPNPESSVMSNSEPVTVPPPPTPVLIPMIYLNEEDVKDNADISAGILSATYNKLIVEGGTPMIYGAVGTKIEDTPALSTSCSDSSIVPTNVTYTCNNLPDGLSIDSGTGVISDTPDDAFSGTSVITATYTAADGTVYYGKYVYAFKFVSANYLKVENMKNLIINKITTGAYPTDPSLETFPTTPALQTVVPGGGENGEDAIINSEDVEYEFINLPDILLYDEHTGVISYDTNKAKSDWPTSVGVYFVKVTVTKGVWYETYKDFTIYAAAVFYCNYDIPVAGGDGDQDPKDTFPSGFSQEAKENPYSNPNFIPYDGESESSGESESAYHFIFVQPNNWDEGSQIWKPLSTYQTMVDYPLEDIKLIVYDVPVDSINDFSFDLNYAPPSDARVLEVSEITGFIQNDSDDYTHPIPEGTEIKIKTAADDDTPDGETGWYFTGTPTKEQLGNFCFFPILADKVEAGMEIYGGGTLGMIVTKFSFFKIQHSLPIYASINEISNEDWHTKQLEAVLSGAETEGVKYEASGLPEFLEINVNTGIIKKKSGQTIPEGTVCRGTYTVTVSKTINNELVTGEATNSFVIGNTVVHGKSKFIAIKDKIKIIQFEDQDVSTIFSSVIVSILNPTEEEKAGLSKIAAKLLDILFFLPGLTREEI